MTSRSALRVRGERRMGVAPLAAVDPRQPIAEIAASPAVQLFVQCARDVVAAFALTEGNAADIARI
ncbi:MAG: hypothetical protein JOY61_21545, partial [Chloroflexi bacterium]|nr:hypothetical protein [Chloroflexota bacterium]